MKLETEELDGGVLKVSLLGRMDIAGVESIAMPFAALAAAHQMRGGAMVILAPPPHIEEVLQIAGVPNVVPVVRDLGAARAALAT
jgi:hypothetical protein